MLGFFKSLGGKAAWRGTQRPHTPAPSSQGQSQPGLWGFLGLGPHGGEECEGVSGQGPVSEGVGGPGKVTWVHRMPPAPAHQLQGQEEGEEWRVGNGGPVGEGSAWAPSTALAGVRPPRSSWGGGGLPWALASFPPKDRRWFCTCGQGERAQAPLGLAHGPSPPEMVGVNEATE